MNGNIPLMDIGLRLILGITLIPLLLLLATKELAQATDSKLARRIAHYITGPMISLLVLFIAIVAISVNVILHQ